MARGAYCPGSVPGVGVLIFFSTATIPRSPSFVYFLLLKSEELGRAASSTQAVCGEGGAQCGEAQVDPRHRQIAPDVLPESGRRRDREQSALRLSLAAALAEWGMCRPPVVGVRRGEA